MVMGFGVESEALARGFGAARGGAAVGARGGVAVGGARAGVAAGPYGGVSAAGSRSGTYVGPRGTTVQAAQVGGVTSGPLGGVHAAGAQGARITTPTGRTYTTGSAGRASVGPYGGVRAGGVHGAVATGPYGGVAAGSRAGVAAGPYGGVAVGASRAVVAGHGTRYITPTTMRTQATYLRGGFNYSCFTPTWYRAHSAAWVTTRWRAPNFWVAPVWPAVSAWCGITAAPLVYDYGSSVVINNDYVYMDGEQVATAEQYADQAAQFADKGRSEKPPETDEWQTLGVFGMVQGDEKTAQHIFQLAVNNTGIVRGNYYDAVADNSLPVYGSVDAKSQRVAWSIGEKKTVVFEAGLNNLTDDQTSVLVHYGKERTEQMMLVRLEEPKQQK
jgi:hypothetical protein